MQGKSFCGRRRNIQPQGWSLDEVGRKEQKETKKESQNQVRTPEFSRFSFAFFRPIDSRLLICIVCKSAKVFIETKTLAAVLDKCQALRKPGIAPTG
jgi:hypothetical protein